MPVDEIVTTQLLKGCLNIVMLGISISCAFAHALEIVLTHPDFISQDSMTLTPLNYFITFQYADGNLKT